MFGIGGRFYLILAACAAVLFGVGLLYYAGYYAGRQQVRVENIERDLENRRAADEVREGVSGLSDDSVFERLRGWTR